MSHRFEEITQNWTEKEKINEEAFQEFMKKEDWRKIKLDTDNPNMNFNNISLVCQKCIFTQVQKYNSSDESNYNKFSVPCSGIPKHYVSDEILDYLKIPRDSFEAKEMEAARNPVIWAEKNCVNEQGTPWIPRWYQISMIQCSSKRLVFRSGRRTGKTDALAVLMLFYAFTQPFYARDPNTGKILLDPKTNQPIQQKTKILCITPRQTHADNLMDKIYGFLERNSVLNNSVLSSKKSPYYIMNFSNGSRITCLTAGTGTASSGVNIRSFSADIVIMDEGNYLGESELEATKAILMTNVNTMLRISSTPKGIQDFFWEMCNAKPEYKEFHFPSLVLPHWDLVKRNVYADVNTEDEFLHEYMAEFSASSEGVFRMDLVQQAMQNYKYSDCRKQEGCVYSIGVDWNSTAGTEIFVIEVNPATGMYKAVYSENVPKSEWTQLNAIERLIRIYRTWRAEVVCVDEGHGHGAIEVIKKYSLEQGRGDILLGALKDRLIVYNFSSKIEIIDPINGRKLKKHAKPFLVQTSVRRFEENKLILCGEDKVLKQQLAHYEIYNITEQGVPKYKCSKAGLGDHKLDAFMLALVGLKLRFGHLDRRSMAVSDTGYIGGPSIEIESRTVNLGRNEAESRTLSNMDYLIKTPQEESNSKYKNIPSRTGFSKTNDKSRQLKGLHNQKPLYNERQSIRRRNVR